MRTEQEYKNLEAERDALTEALAEWKASAYRSQTDCDAAGATIQQLSDERDALAARVTELLEALSSADFAADGWSNSFYNALQHIKNLRDGISDFGSVLANLEECAKQSQADWRPALYRTVLATHDDSAAILARHDAAIWLEAAEVCEGMKYSNAQPHHYAAALRARAAELWKAQ